MNIRCERCNSDIDYKLVDKQNMTAECKLCNQTFDCTEQFQGRPEGLPNCPLPRMMSIDVNDQRAIIDRRWFGLKYIILGLLAVPVDIMGVILAFNTGLNELSLILLCAGGMCTMGTLIGFVNKSRIIVNFNEIRMFHTPFKWIHSMQIPSHKVKRIYCKESQHVNDELNTSSTIYGVYALDSDDYEHLIISYLENIDQALYIEKAIETFLKLED
jgi:hypothetical protein